MFGDLVTNVNCVLKMTEKKGRRGDIFPLKFQGYKVQQMQSCVHRLRLMKVGKDSQGATYFRDICVEYCMYIVCILYVYIYIHIYSNSPSTQKYL